MSQERPFVYDDGQTKSLYFSLDQLQSRMIKAQPAQLEMDYTRTMMGVLMFDSQPLHITMIGLGGGSMLKFLYQQLPQARLTVIEINPQVIALREEFEIPHDPQRIRIVCADGADFVRDTTERFDVLLVDGFDIDGQAPSLCTQAFYDACFQCLAEQGVLAVNLHRDHPDYGIFTGRLRLAFDGNLLEVSAEEKSNSIVFASKGPKISIDLLRGTDPLAHLDKAGRAQLQREFGRITWLMTQTF